MNNLVVWFSIWFLVWGAYNIYFKWKIDAVRNEKYFFTSLYFLISTIFAYFIFYKHLSYNHDLILAFLITIFLGSFFTNYYPYIKHIRNGKYFLITLSFSILFQQTTINAGVSLLPSLFGFIFMIGHFPVIFLNWARFRYLYLALTFFGGLGFSYLITNFSGVGVMLSFLIHYCFYIPVFYYLRDARKV